MSVHGEYLKSLDRVVPIQLFLVDVQTRTVRSVLDELEVVTETSITQRTGNLQDEEVEIVAIGVEEARTGDQDLAASMHMIVVGEDDRKLVSFHGILEDAGVEGDADAFTLLVGQLLGIVGDEGFGLIAQFAFIVGDGGAIVRGLGGHFGIALSNYTTGGHINPLSYLSR